MKPLTMWGRCHFSTGTGQGPDDMADLQIPQVAPIIQESHTKRQALSSAGPYRTSMLYSWQQQCVAMGIPYSSNFSLATTLSSAVEMREWAIQGLPSDAVSTDNGILATRGHRWPLMIDPQDQANRYACRDAVNAASQL